MSSGIYMIFNNESYNFYIGSSKLLNKRFKEHQRFLRKNVHHSPILQRAYDKDPYTLEFIIIEYCEIENLTNREQHYLDFFNPQYNISKSATSPMKGRKHSEETKKLFRQQRLGKSLKQPKHSLERRLAQSIRNTGTKRSEETRKKMSETAKRINSISRINRDNTRKKIKDNRGNVFNSLTEMAKFHKVSIQTVCDILKGRHFKTRNGAIFNYV